MTRDCFSSKRAALSQHSNKIQQQLSAKYNRIVALAEKRQCAHCKCFSWDSRCPDSVSVRVFQSSEKQARNSLITLTNLTNEAKAFAIFPAGPSRPYRLASGLGPLIYSPCRRIQASTVRTIGLVNSPLKT